MDLENQRRTEELGAKVNRLKHLTLDMDKELKNQNNFLGSMGFDFESTSSLLKGGAGRITGMINSGKSNRKIMFYTIIVIVLSFMILYKILMKVRG
ncbi:BET1 [Brachionus plicatilis]|uniref:BET1 n=1 Tax=Brachionus plicatilis TaxID=10195 RepID=A0A3M7QA19_BRAPC|nr:BET1 [Brachionus plicatilis]